MKPEKLCAMAYLKKDSENGSCLECGKPLYGRPDKKFCCSACKNEWHYRKEAEVKLSKSRTLTVLNRNYMLLESLLDRKIKSIGLWELEQMGFQPKTITGYIKSRRNSEEYACFNIIYRQDASRIYNIRKIQTATSRDSSCI